MPPRSFQKGRGWSSAESVSGYYELLPHLELTTVYNAINIGGTAPTVGFAATNPVNSTVYRARLSQFLCPSDSYGEYPSGGANSYRFNLGSSNPLGTGLIELPAGAFEPNQSTRPQEFIDGLSQTVGFAERLVGSQSPGQFSNGRDFWGASVLGLFPIKTDDAVLSICRSLSGVPPSYDTNLGQTWMEAGNTQVWYNHVAPPNDRGSDCETGSLNSQESNYCQFCSVAVRSAHPGGANCLLMDGSVRLVRSATDLRVWRAIGTRAGGEAVDGGW
jgi:prepilin-type processing-associated H-X9-DG protein